MLEICKNKVKISFGFYIVSTFSTNSLVIVMGNKKAHFFCCVILLLIKKLLFKVIKKILIFITKQQRKYKPLNMEFQKVLFITITMAFLVRTALPSK